MPRQIVYTPKAAKPPATYGQAVKAAGLVFISGTAPHDPANGQIKGTTIQEQTRQCLTNIAAILDEAGSSLEKVVSVTIVLAEANPAMALRNLIVARSTGIWELAHRHLSESLRLVLAEVRVVDSLRTKTDRAR